MPSKRDLTKKQHRFVVAYIESLDPHAAAIAAGYSARRAKGAGERLLNQRLIIEAIAREGAEVQHDRHDRQGAQITRQWIMAELAELYRTVRACLPASTSDGGRAPSGASLQSAIKMLELLIKHLEEEGREEDFGESDSQSDLSRLSRDELRQLEAILARTLPSSSSAGACRTEPR